MQLKQVWNDKIAKDFGSMTEEEQSKLYRKFRRQFEVLNTYKLQKSNELYYNYLEDAIIMACNGDVVAQDYLTFAYKKGREGLFEPNLLRGYMWGIVASANGSKLSTNRLRFFFNPAYYEIAEHPRVDEIIDKYNLNGDTVEHFFASTLSDMIMGISDVNIKGMSHLPVIPQNYSPENIRELERLRDRLINKMMDLL